MYKTRYDTGYCHVLGYAQAFKVQTLARGMKLAPGMQILRRVQYVCVKSSVNASSLPIYVDNKRYEITLSA